MTRAFILFTIIAALTVSSCRGRKKAQALKEQEKLLQTTADPNAQKPGNPPNDIRVVIHEEMLNKCFAAMGAIKGKEPFEIMFMKDTCHWALINPRINLHPGKADFTTDVSVVSGPFSYTTKCKGDVKIWYDRPKNLINVQITKAVISLDTKVLSKKVHIMDYDLAPTFKDPFTFEGPTATETDMDMEMPDGTVKKLYMTTSDCDLKVEEKQIVVPCEVQFTTVPPVKKTSK